MVKLRPDERVKSFIVIYIGTLLSALGVNLFIVHAHLVSGGASGVALIIQYLSGFSAGYTILLLNVPLLLLSYFKIDKKFTFYTIIGTSFLSLNLVLTSFSKNILSINDILLLSIYGGVLNGLGNGLVLSNHGSTGGLDIISAYIRKKRENTSIATISLIQNILIIALGSVFFGLSSGLFSLISMYITSVVMDRTIKGFNRKKLLLIITGKETEVSEAIMKDLKRGVTFLYGEGAYTHKEKKIIYCALSLREVPKVKHIVRTKDPAAFISILDVGEVEGEGFKHSFIG